MPSKKKTKKSSRNTNYVRGRNFEYSVMRHLRAKKYYCIRAYGSKGLYDVIAVAPQRESAQETLDIDTICPNCYNQRPLLIQAKLNGYVPPKEREKLKETNKFDGLVLIAWSDKPKGSKIGKLKFRTLDNIEVEVN